MVKVLFLYCFFNLLGMQMDLDVLVLREKEAFFLGLAMVLIVVSISDIS